MATAANLWSTILKHVVKSVPLFLYFTPQILLVRQNLTESSKCQSPDVKWSSQSEGLVQIPLKSVKDPFRDHWVWCDPWPITQWSQISDSFKEFLGQRCPHLAGSSTVSLVQCSTPDNHTYFPWPPNSACSGKDWSNPVLMPSSLWADLFTGHLSSPGLHENLLF